MPADDELLRLARQSAETDLPFLLRAKEVAKKRMKENPTPENVGGFNRARQALESELARRQGQSATRSYKTQLDAVAYLKDAGYKCSKSQFNRDVKARKVPRMPEGWFDEAALLGYASANLTPAGQVADRQLADATTSRLSADAELKKYQAERARLKLEKEQGLLMPRADHERDLGARALFFRNEVRNFIHLHGAAMIHLVGGEEAKLRELVQWWLETTEIWMDAWSGEREFLLEDGDSGDSLPPEGEDA